MHALLEAWKDFDASRRPHVLLGDEAILADDRRICRYDGWHGFIANPDFGKPDRRLHLDLLPIPFVGNLEAASIFLLLLNPGFGPHDYLGNTWFQNFAQRWWTT